MVTRSLIAIEHRNGTVESIYCHNYGHPEDNGAKLLKHYTDREKVERLIALGELSVLGARLEPTTGKQENWYFPEKGTTCAYHRDRQDDWDSVKPMEYASLQEFTSEDVMRVHYDIDYVYVFTQENVWTVHTKGYEKPLQPQQRLQDVLRKTLTKRATT